MTFRFKDCELDVDARRLRCRGHEAHLSPKAFDVLTLLIEARPRVLSKADLLERAWPGTFVTDASLARVINEIRAAIGDRARDAGVVRTVHGHGYTFAAEIVEVEGRDAAPGPIVCWLIARGYEVGLPDGEHTIGRDPEALVCINSPKVSRRHARVTVSGRSAILQDLDSKNGVFVHGERVVGPCALHSGDEILIGPIALGFRVIAPPPSTETVALPSLPD